MNAVRPAQPKRDDLDATGETVRRAAKKGCRECEYPTSPVALSLGDRLQILSTIYPDAQRLT